MVALPETFILKKINLMLEDLSTFKNWQRSFEKTYVSIKKFDYKMEKNLNLFHKIHIKISTAMMEFYLRLMLYLKCTNKIVPFIHYFYW